MTTETDSPESPTGKEATPATDGGTEGAAPPYPAPPSTELPSTTKVLEFERGGIRREVALVGTAHVSARSVDDVRQAIEVFEPDTVCVELCEARYRNIVDKAAWRKLDIFKVLREGKAPLLLSSLLMTSFQRRIAEELGVEPGAEMIEGIEQAKARNVDLVLADRDIQVTLRRTWAGLGFFQKLRMLGQMLGGVLFAHEIDEQTIEQLKEEEELHGMLDSLAEAFPDVKSTLIDERDVYLAQKIRAAEGERIVAVVGAGHVRGIVEHLQREQPLEPLETVPSPSWVPRFLKWAIPALVIGLIGYGFVRGGAEQSLETILIWFLVNGTLSAVGTALALGHPLSVVSAFLAAPLTSLNPFIAAGWVAGLVQAWIKRPTVEDLENLPQAITTIRGFWGNPVSRVLLVVVFANLGSSLGTFIGGSWIAARLF